MLGQIEAKATGTDRMVAHLPGRERAVSVDIGKVFAALSDRHVEVMRDELSEIYHAAGRAFAVKAAKSLIPGSTAAAHASRAWLPTHRRAARRYRPGSPAGHDSFQVRDFTAPA